MAVHLLGIRHHGPGSARHLRAALEAIKPSIILVEGPPEGEAVLKWMAHADMQPPVALLAYVPDDPQKSVFYPFAEFSPEFQAIRYGLDRKIPVRLIDMPLVHKLATEMPDENAEGGTIADEEELVQVEDAEEAEAEAVFMDLIHRNPLDYLGQAAGFEDGEAWWDHQFEMSRQPEEVFQAAQEAITALRAEMPPTTDINELRREAFMRRAIKAAEKDLYADIVVVCGAWHVPALATMPKQKDDDALLKGLPKTKVEATWIPWTSDRLAFASGYGAGVNSPGWYKHCWQEDHDDGTLWLSHVAQIFRKHQIDVSSAHVIEAVRLANALAALRGLHRAGLTEFNEATQSIMCMGDAILMQIIWRELIVGHEMGAIPEGTPQVPLQRDLDQQIRSLRLKITAEDRPLNLDLREESGIQKSILLHRLLVLDIKWGRTQYASGKGTFKEDWVLCWQPELTIQLLEKAPWGNTVEVAANQYLAHLAQTITQLDAITALVQRALPASLDAGIEKVMQRMDELASTTHDILSLMAAFIPLVQVRKYGNVRGTNADTIEVILGSIFYRMTASLPSSCTGIDEETASGIASKIREVQHALMILDQAEFLEVWIETLAKMLDNDMVAPMVLGTVSKILYDLRYLDAAHTGVIFSRALSPGHAPNDAAAWLEGFMRDAATVLILDETIWSIVNDWIRDLDMTVFQEVIPLLRRTFAVYNAVEKRKIAEKVKQGAGNKPSHLETIGMDAGRGAKVLPILEKLMGL